MDIETEISDTLAKELQQEIDNSLMAEILTETGWTKVTYHYNNVQQALDIIDWLKENCSDRFQRLGSGYYFKDKKDAEWFILRWT